MAAAANAETQAGTEAGTEAPQRSKKKLILLAVPLLLLGAGAGLWFSGVLPGMLGMNASPEAQLAEGEAAPPVPQAAPRRSRAGCPPCATASPRASRGWSCRCFPAT